MKTTIELPDITFRRAKALAAVHGITLRQLITDAIEQQLRRRAVAARTGPDPSGAIAEPRWMSGFGRLSDLREENRFVLDAIEDEFERLTADDIR